MNLAALTLFVVTMPSVWPEPYLFICGHSWDIDNKINAVLEDKPSMQLVKLHNLPIKLYSDYDCAGKKGNVHCLLKSVNTASGEGICALLKNKDS